MISTKHIKYSLIALVVVFGLLRLSIYVIRMPSYDIKTNGKLYVVSKVSKEIQVFDLGKGEVTAKIPIDMQAYDAVTTSDKKRLVLTNYGAGESDMIKVIGTQTNKIEHSIQMEGTARTNGIVALPNAKGVGVVDLVNNEVVLLNIATGGIERKIPIGQEKSHLLVLHPNKPMAYVTNMDSGSVSVVDLELNKVIKTIPCRSGRMGMAITPDGSELWVSNTNENSISVIDTKDHEIIAELTTGNNPLKLKFTKNGSHCLVANALEGNVFVYDQKTKKKIKTIHLRGKRTFLERVLYSTPRPVNILMHPNGLYAFVANSNANHIEVIELKTYKVVSTISTGKVPDAMAFLE